MITITKEHNILNIQLLLLQVISQFYFMAMKKHTLIYDKSFLDILMLVLSAAVWFTYFLSRSKR